ncbi:MAG: hypothetical protein WAM70_09435 [Pyrinomonadaceae bacterium]
MSEHDLLLSENRSQRRFGHIFVGVDAKPPPKDLFQFDFLPSVKYRRARTFSDGLYVAGVQSPQFDRDQMPLIIHGTDNLLLKKTMMVSGRPSC